MAYILHNWSETRVPAVNLHIEMDSNGTWYAKLYYKRDDFNVLQSYLPILATTNVWSVSQHTVTREPVENAMIFLKARRLVG
jgi:hypothetical protein